MPDGITEFIELDPQEMHLVPSGANRFPFLLAKAAGDEVAAAAFEEACKADPPGDDYAEKFVSAEDRRKMASAGVAMPNGAFPIPDEKHLRYAVGFLEHYKGNHAKAKAHIIKRARALGLVRLLPKEWNVTKDVSTAESLSQTEESPAHLGPEGSPDAEDRGRPRHVAAQDEYVDLSSGQGDTAPDKDLHRSEAESQTAGAQTNKAEEPTEADGRGDTAPDKDLHRSEAESQTEADTEKAPFVSMDNSALNDPAADKDPGNPAWEHKDAALADCASHLISRANELIQMLGQRERAEKGTSPLTQETEGAIRRSIEGLEKTLVDNQSPVSKEEIEMTNDELMKLLDERDAARRQDKKARKEKKAAKVAKAEKKVAKAQGTETETAEDADASKAVQGDGASPEVVQALSAIAEMQKTVQAIAAQDAKRPMVNAAGLTAALRGPEGEDALKSFDDNVAEAEERLAKARAANDTYAAAAATSDLNVARHQRTAIKMITSENARERDPQMTTRALRGQGVPLLSNRHALPEDPALRAI